MPVTLFVGFKSIFHSKFFEELRANALFHNLPSEEKHLDNLFL